MGQRVHVVGVGMVPFATPSKLRGQAGPRQVDDVTVALQHNIGLGGAAVVTMYEKVD